MTFLFTLYDICSTENKFSYEFNQKRNKQKGKTLKKIVRSQQKGQLFHSPTAGLSDCLSDEKGEEGEQEEERHNPVTVGVCDSVCVCSRAT